MKDKPVVIYTHMYVEAEDGISKIKKTFAVTGTSHESAYGTLMEQLSEIFPYGCEFRVLNTIVSFEKRFKRLEDQS